MIIIVHGTCCSYRNMIIRLKHPIRYRKKCDKKIKNIVVEEGAIMCKKCFTLYVSAFGAAAL